jgi:hypothetical protein
MFLSRSLTPPELESAWLVTSGTELMFFTVGTVAGMPIAFMMPRLRVGFMGRAWRLPSTTYLMPRWVVWMFIGTFLGQLIALVVLALLEDYRLFWLATSISLGGGAFCVGAWQRMKKHRGTEFAMPFLWPWMRLRLIGFRTNVQVQELDRDCRESPPELLQRHK